MALNNPNDISLKVGFDIDKFTQSLNQTNSLLNKWSTGIQSQLLGAFTIQGSISLFKQGVEAAISSMANFSHQMSEVKALTQQTTEGVRGLRDSALELSGAFKAIDIARLETEFSRLGFSTDEILNSTKATIALASATGSDLARSAEIAGSTLRSFGLDAKEMGRVTDVMAGALNRTGLDMSNFAESIKYVAPQARAANISIEETSALLGVLADNGIKGSMAGTTLRRILQDIATDGRPLQVRLEELAARGLTLSGAMDEVGRIGSTGLLVLTSNTDKIVSLSKALNNVTGEAEAMAKVMNDDLIGDWKKFNAEVDKTVQEGGKLEGFFRGATQAATRFFAGFNSDKKTILNSALYEFNNQEESFRNIERLKQIATAAGEKIGIEWDKTGKIIKSAFIVDNSQWESMMKSFQVQGIAALPSYTPVEDPYSPSKARKASLEATAGRRYDLPDPSQLSEISKVLKGFTDQADQIWFTSDAFTAMGKAMKELNKDVNFDEAMRRSEGFEKGMVKIGTSLKKISLGLTQAFQSMAVGIGEAIGQALSGGNFGAALLSTIGSVAKQFGQMAIAFGIAAIGIEAAITLDNPFAAIAAGIALVALGSAASSQGAALAQSSSGGSSAVQSRQADMKMEITGQLSAKGPDLALVLNKNNYNVQRVGG